MLYLPLNSSTQFVDSSQKQNNFSNKWAVSFTTYEWVDCAYFPWTANGYATWPISFPSETNYTISFRVHPISWNYLWVLADYTNYGFGKSFKCWVFNTKQIGFEWYWSNWDWTATCSISWDSASYAGDKWNHIVFVRTTEWWCPNMTVYVNNVIFHWTTSWWERALDVRTRTAFAIWNDPYDWLWKTTRMSKMHLSNLIVESKSWTSEDVAKYYNGTKEIYWH